MTTLSADTANLSVLLQVADDYRERAVGDINPKLPGQLAEVNATIVAEYAQYRLD